ncbi:MAG: ribonuclease HII [Candidatus Saccharibacteria bacterium]
MILGIDEVGRGPWAGPLVIGAVVLGGAVIDGLTDSKKLSKKQRDRLDVEIRAKAVGIGLGWVEAAVIDEIGLSQALILATKLAVEQITVPYHEIIIDGTVNFLAETSKGRYVTTMKKADLLVPSVSAASIVAKVARDNYMELQDEVYPGYGFKNHVGYGTAAHIAAINKLGVTPLHRLSFAPLVKYRSNDRQSDSAFSQNGFAPGTIRASVSYRARVADVLVQKGVRVASVKPTSKQIGNSAENAASEYLVRAGHKILDRNWKTKYCEIDIVSQKGDTIYFCEVKYRKTDQQGGGLEVINKKKVNQMRFAAEFYALSNQISDVSLRLVAMALSGQPPQVVEFVEI